MPPIRTAVERMKTLGFGLAGAAGLAVPELEELLLIYGREPELWAEDLEAFLGAVHRYAEAPAFTSP